MATNRMTPGRKAEVTKLRAERVTLRNPKLTPIYSETTMPGREAHLAKCPKCKKIVHYERPLPHGPRSDTFEIMARKELEKHVCGKEE